MWVVIRQLSVIGGRVSVHRVVVVSVRVVRVALHVAGTWMVVERGVWVPLYRGGVRVRSGLVALLRVVMQNVVTRAGGLGVGGV